MLKSYLIIAVRNLLKQKIFTLINVFGLAIGVTCCMLIGFYVHHEWRYDRHHPDAEQIYRIVRENTDATGNRSFTNYTSGALNQLFRNEVPGIRKSVHMMRRSVWVKSDEKELRHLGCLADPEILNVFALPLIRGDHQTALTTPGGILVTESAARAHFGKADPIGKVVRADNFLQGEYIITGVLKDLPKTSLLKFGFLTSTVPNWQNTDFYRSAWEQWHSGWPNENYVVLEPTTRPENIEQLLLTLVPQYAGDTVRGKLRHHLQPLVRAHLFAKQDYGYSSQGALYRTNGDIRRVYVAALLGIFIILLAGINFVNLSTARSTLRAKEVGMRKVVGAHRGQIVSQLLGESILLSVLAHLFALVMVQVLLPKLSSWMGITVSIAQMGFWLFPVLLGSVLIIGLLAGCCPAFFTSKFKPIAALKGHFAKGAGGASLRQGLVLFQFSISVLLIAGTWVVLSQWQFMVGKDLGYNKENVVCMPYPIGDPPVVRQQFLNHPNVLYVCVTNNAPIYASSFTVRPEGETENWRMHFFDLDVDVVNVLGVELIQGRDFSEDIQSDKREAFMLNEAAVKAFGWKDPIGKSIQWGSQTAQVIGVVKDFHFESLQEEIKPLILGRIGNSIHLSLRIDSKNLTETMAFIEKTWKELRPDRSFTYQFLDQRLERMYRPDMRAGQMFSVATGLAILIACLGLVGLASFSTEQRTKEIGIRKVLGATEFGLVGLFTRDFIKPVALANLLMIPVSIYLTWMWLDQFAYHIALGPWPFVMSAGLSLLIATLTVSLITFRATIRNPVEALRSE